MRRWTFFAAIAVVACRVTVAAEPSRPNVLFIIADDLGYGDVGVFHQNERMAAGKPAFATPNLDALAASGVMMRQHYTGSPVCAPARASLQTGLMQGNCPIRDNQFDKPIPAELMTLGNVLQKAGYYTGAIGKWGLGGKPKGGYPAHPMKRGYDSFFGFMLHGTGHTYYHDKAHPLMDGERDVGGEYENVYSTDLLTARAKQFITERARSEPGRPFFLYLAYTAVHGALNVPGGPYPAGAGLNGGARWPVQPTPETRDKWIHPDYAGKPWGEPMKRYATMARRLDDGVGDLLQLLRDLHIDGNTLVVFTSDNGPEDWSGSDPRFFESWGPFDGIKRDVFEGGVREPTIVAWPGARAGGSEGRDGIGVLGLDADAGGRGGAAGAGAVRRDIAAAGAAGSRRTGGRRIRLHGIFLREWVEAAVGGGGRGAEGGNAGAAADGADRGLGGRADAGQIAGGPVAALRRGEGPPRGPRPGAGAGSGGDSGEDEGVASVGEEAGCGCAATLR